MKTSLRAAILLLVVGSIVYLESLRPSRVASVPSTASTAQVDRLPVSVGDRSSVIAAKQRRYEHAPEISTPDGFINTPSTGSGNKPVSIGGHRGKKVVLVDFWTYSCINCQRTIPYLNAWYEKYRDKGFEIIGVHTPEFQFEQKYENVLAAVKKFGIRYPVVLDNDYSTWTDYRNRYWPRKYLVDIDGFIVFDHIGEGGYDETEKKIQEALAERMAALGEQDTVSRETVGTRAESSQAQSPEVYFGADRNTLLANGKRSTVGTQTLSAPGRVATNELSLVGRWAFQPEYARSVEANARVLFRYRAKNVYLVSSAPDVLSAQLLLDGKPLGARRGKDVKEENGKSSIRFAGDGLSHLVSDPDGIGEHTLEIILPQPGLLLYTLTFG